MLTAGLAAAEAVWRLTAEAYRPDRGRLHPPSAGARSRGAGLGRSSSTKSTTSVAIPQPWPCVEHAVLCCSPSSQLLKVHLTFG